MPSPDRFLLFRLWGPMASWGQIAIGEQRQTWTRPSRSAVLGLVAAAHGIERVNAAEHLDLETRIGFAVRVDNAGRPLRDYHTAQAPVPERGRRWQTRRDELFAAKARSTKLSERDYLLDMNAVVALWLRTNGVDLAAIADRLRQPVFTLYLGRKACPLGHPLRPRLHLTPDLSAAFREFDAGEAREKVERVTYLEEIRSKAKRRFAEPDRVPDLRARVWMDGEPQPRREHQIWLDTADVDLLPVAGRPVHTQRRDRIVDRRTWSFGDRRETCVTIGGEE